MFLSFQSSGAVGNLFPLFLSLDAIPFTRLTICFLCILTIYKLSHLGFEGWIWVLIASVPDLCIMFTLSDHHGTISVQK